MDARPYDWSDLEIFLAAARGGTLASAAEALRVDASTVHRRIGKLEAAMRAGLFVRSPRGYALTEAGQDLYAHALAMEEQATVAFRKVVARDEKPMGAVRVATVETLAVNVLPPIVATFRAKHPNVTIVVDSRQSLVDLAKHEADVALRFGVTPTEGDVVARRVLSADIGLFASRGYLKKHGRPKTPEDLYDHMLVRAAEAHVRLPLERALERYANPAKIALRAESFYARIGAIRAGVGIGFVPLFLAAGDKSLERLHLAFPETPRGVDLLLIIHVDMRKNARVRAFAEHAFAALVAQRSVFEGSD
jgi:DNA-binding transcriptional LysR family regulator